MPSRRGVGLLALRHCAIACAVACTVAAHADEADLAKSKNCLNCHAIDHKVVGPAFRDVAARYANDRDAAARLAAKIRSGGGGAWGVVPMPSNAVSTAEADRLARWVLTQK